MNSRGTWSTPSVNIWDWFYSPRLLAFFPLACVAYLLTSQLFQEWRANVEVERELNRVSAEGYPTTANKNIRDEILSTENTITINRIQMLSSHPWGTQRLIALPYIGHDTMPLAFLSPNAKWPEAPRAAEFLEHMQPLFEEIDKLGDSKERAWLPSRFLWGTKIYASLRQIQSTLELAFDHAIYTKDGSTAMQMLRRMGSVAMLAPFSTSDSGHGLGLERRRACSFINRSMYAGVWSITQLEELHKKLSVPMEFSKQWKDFVAIRRANWTTLRDEKVSLKRPTDRLRALRNFRKAMDWFEGSPIAIADRLSKLKFQNWTTNRFVDWYWASNAGDSLVDTATEYLKSEMERRQTLIAVAVKEFQIKNQRWPNELRELETLGLSAELWEDIGRNKIQLSHSENEAQVVLETMNVFQAGINPKEEIRIR